MNAFNSGHFIYLIMADILNVFHLQTLFQLTADIYLEHSYLTINYF